MRWMLVATAMGCGTGSAQLQVEPATMMPGGIPSVDPLPETPPTPMVLDMSGPWNEIATCGGLRMMVSNGSTWLALEVELEMQSSALSGEPLTVEYDLSDRGWIVAFDHEASEDDLCGSIEEFPGIYGEYWRTLEGSVTISFQPDRAFTMEELYDAPLDEVAWLTISREEELELVPNDPTSPSVQLGPFEWTGRLAKLDLPA